MGRKTGHILRFPGTDVRKFCVTILRDDIWELQKPWESQGNDVTGWTAKWMSKSGARNVRLVLLVMRWTVETPKSAHASMQCWLPVWKDSYYSCPRFFPESNNGYKYTMIMMDYFSKWSDANALPNQTNLPLWSLIRVKLRPRMKFRVCIFPESLRYS